MAVRRADQLCCAGCTVCRGDFSRNAGHPQQFSVIDKSSAMRGRSLVLLSSMLPHCTLESWPRNILGLFEHFLVCLPSFDTIEVMHLDHDWFVKACRTSLQLESALALPSRILLDVVAFLAHVYLAVGERQLWKLALLWYD